MIRNITVVLDQTKQPGEPSPGGRRPDKLYDDSVLRALYDSAAVVHDRPGDDPWRSRSSRPLSDADWDELQPVGLFKAEPIHFKRNGAEFSDVDDVPTKLAKVAEKMRQWPQYYLRVEGNTRARTTPTKTASWRKDRANSVKEASGEAPGRGSETPDPCGGNQAGPRQRGVTS